MAPQYPDLTTFKALSFDCYGTLIDWESGMIKALSPILAQLPSSHPFRAEPLRAVERLSAISDDLEKSKPRLVYNENLAMSITSLCHELDVPASDAYAEPFGNAPGTWPAFPDTIPGLQVLAKHYKLIILSNIHNTAIAGTVDNQLSPVKFDAVYTAQDIGSYKPDLANFRYLFAHAKDELGIDWGKGDLLHVAHSLTADHVPAKELGLRSVWIARGADKPGSIGATLGDCEELRDKVAYEWKFETIGDFAEEVARQFEAKDSKS